MRPDILAQQALYLMQNEHGLVKIGRSINPESRRRALETQEHCEIRLVHVLPSEGFREERVHQAVDEHRLVGEWFDATPTALAEISEAFAPGVDIWWPFNSVGSGARDWLDRYAAREAVRWVPREVTRRFGYLRRAKVPNWTTDLFAWELHWLMERGECVPSHLESEGRDTVIFAEVDGVCVRVPAFSRDLSAALSLWPPARTPTDWAECAFECCKAGLDARRADWRRRLGLRASRLLPSTDIGRTEAPQ